MDQSAAFKSTMAKREESVRNRERVLHHRFDTNGIATRQEIREYRLLIWVRTTMIHSEEEDSANQDESERTPTCNTRIVAREPPKAGLAESILKLTKERWRTVSEGH